MDAYFSDALIIGAGLAGERAAIEIASEGFSVNIISLVPPRQSHSNAAQGGVQASLNNTKETADDNWRIHFDDTVKGSDWGADQRVVEKICKLAPELVRQFDYWGAAFSRTKEGKINQRAFGGASKPRCAFASDETGHILLNILDSQVMALKIPIFIRRQLLSLIYTNEEVIGVTALNLVKGTIEVFTAKVIILATGGAGRLYEETTNSRISFGDGCAVALETGLVPVGNPEAIQFHPTCLVPTSILVTEGCRGDGGVLLDKNGREFMGDYCPTMKNPNLASRDVVSRSMMRHIKKNFGVESPYGPHLWLDIKRLGKEHIKTKLSGVDLLCRDYVNVNPIKEYIPVRPSQHYTMFGIKTGESCEVYGLARLFAVGECACWDVHGFNRLGGNSLLETIAAGYTAGQEAGKYLYMENTQNFSDLKIAEEYQKQTKRLEELTKNRGKENVFGVYREIQKTLTEKVGIFRKENELKEAVAKLAILCGKTQRIKLGYRETAANLELQLALRLPGMAKLALCTAQAALLRKESRGSHYREDYPDRDDKNWLKRTLAYFPEENDLPRIEYEPVEITLLPPGDRGYGEKK
ncbi:MAG: FAD-binding protein [Candidatus Nealsonbacteria bacterium]|nr:FAD-binding protein [Candidatus Nealsonbacteria bacterium]